MTKFSLIFCLGFFLFSNGEDVTLTILPAAPEKYSGKLSQSSHTDTTWYTVMTIPDELYWVGWTKALSILVSGHSGDQTTASWAYHFFAYMRNYNGTVTSGETAETAIVEYDSNYEVRATVSSNDLLIQVRRNGGSDYQIEWAAEARAVMY